MILPICWVPASLLSAISCAYCGPAIWYGPGGMAKIFLCAGRRPRRCHHFNGAGAYPAHERRKGQWLIINMKAPAAANRQIRNRSQKIASPTDILMSTAGVNITMTMRTTTAMDITTRAAPAAWIMISALKPAVKTAVDMTTAIPREKKRLAFNHRRGRTGGFQLSAGAGCRIPSNAGGGCRHRRISLVLVRDQKHYPPSAG